MMNALTEKPGKREPESMPSGFDPDVVAQLSNALTALMADLFALYIKTKNFHWHVSGPHFRDYHRLLDEQSGQIFATTDDIAERVRKIGGVTLHSIGQIARLQPVADNDENFVPARRRLAELCEDNAQLTLRLRSAHSLCDEYGDVATASLIENWIDEAEHRICFLYEATRPNLEKWENVMSIGRNRLNWATCACLVPLVCGLGGFAPRANAQTVASLVATRSTTGEPSTSEGAGRGDAELQERVAAALHAQRYFDDRHIDISVRGGAVILSGTVFNDWDLQDALRTARKAAGGRRVVDSLSIEEGGR